MVLCWKYGRCSASSYDGGREARMRGEGARRRANQQRMEEEVR